MKTLKYIITHSDGLYRITIDISASNAEINTLNKQLIKLLKIPDPIKEEEL